MSGTTLLSALFLLIGFAAGAVWDENPQCKWLVWLVFGALIASICFGLVEVIKWAIGA